ncbi:hypothetical protein ACH41H_23595 [Streptomyces sp. NPDC020800]|uniref:hypothetical protein n=1 Tax=Streptomyces sp. NPDC020800 TaxID=3365092 RepID=UPI0037A19ECF
MAGVFTQDGVAAAGHRPFVLVRTVVDTHRADGECVLHQRLTCGELQVPAFVPLWMVPADVPAATASGAKARAHDGRTQGTAPAAVSECRGRRPLSGSRPHRGGGRLTRVRDEREIAASHTPDPEERLTPNVRKRA